MESPSSVIETWVELFNAGDAERLAELYHEDATNHQVVFPPVVGRSKIHDMFRNEFARAEMICIVENIFSDGEWGILEWRDPQGLRGCGFFHVVRGRIKFQRGYWDRQSFEELHDTKLR